ncbi:MAG: group II intron reverse transcriptase/maturase [Deltaproteobacteria bacterium RBG_16_47_11]|nr:MAG: group II intron reverse transcriptase/maturase [Deltaproteobacteria bacterium RBG_16_47_11]
MSSGMAKSPIGGGGSRRVNERRSLGLISVEGVVKRENMLSAWKQVRANQGTYGIDGISIERFPLYVHENWEGIKQSLLEGEYQPSPVKRVEVPKDSGGTRNLGIPTVMDRVIQQAITQVLSPVFDPHFSESSFGFRPGRSAHQAVRKVLKDTREGYHYAVDIDVEKFFDTVDHDVLVSRVSRWVTDKGLLRLIGRYLRCGVVVNGRLNQTAKGVPQGGPLSPMLSNILLDDLDKELEKRGHRFARYADDLIILVKSERAAHRVMASISRFLERKLKVKVNKDKSKVVRAQDCFFLGFTFTRMRLTSTEKAIHGFKTKLRRLTGRSWGVSMPYRYASLSRYIQGWMNYFGVGMKYNDVVELDHWLRRRIRMCYWKQWRRARKRIGELIKLGSARYQAIRTGLSRKSYWHLAKTLSTNMGLSKAFLEKQGLVSIRTLWIQIHYPAKAR